MISLSKLLEEIIEESIKKNLGKYNSILLHESYIFQELADPEWAYDYKQISKYEWEFNDKYGNLLGVRFLPDLKYFESFYKMKSKTGRDVIVFDLEQHKDKLDLLSFQGGTDDHRSDTICKILLDEIIPNYLLNQKPSLIKLHPLNKYRHKIFYKCAEICKKIHPQLEIKEVGNEIYLINK